MLQRQDIVPENGVSEGKDSVPNNSMSMMRNARMTSQSHTRNIAIAKMPPQGATVSTTSGTSSPGGAEAIVWVEVCYPGQFGPTDGERRFQECHYGPVRDGTTGLGLDNASSEEPLVTTVLGVIRTIAIRRLPKPGRFEESMIEGFGLPPCAPEDPWIPLERDFAIAPSRLVPEPEAPAEDEVDQQSGAPEITRLNSVAQEKQTTSPKNNR